MDYDFKQCSLCRAFIRFKSKKNQNSGNLRFTTSLGCAVCNYKDRITMYENQLLLDLDNKVYINQKWVKVDDPKEIPKRLKRTITWMHKAFDEITVKEILASTLTFYLHRDYFNLMKNHR